TVPAESDGKRLLLPCRAARLENHFVSGAAGLIYGLDNLERLNSLFASDKRFTAAANCAGEVFKLALEGRKRDRHGIGGAGGDIPGNGCRFAGIVLYIPGC